MRSSSLARASLIITSVVSLVALGCSFQQSASPSGGNPAAAGTGGSAMGGSPIIVTSTGTGGANGAGSRDGGAPGACVSFVSVVGSERD